MCDLGCFFVLMINASKEEGIIEIVFQRFRLKLVVEIEPIL